MKLIKSILGVAVIAAILVSCSTSDKVVSGKFIQKRKYNKGLHVNLKGKMKKPDSVTLAKTSARKAKATKAEAPVVATAQEVPAQLALLDCLGMTPSNPEAFGQIPDHQQDYAITSARNIDKPL